MIAVISRISVLFLLAVFVISGCRDKNTEYIVPPADGRVIGNVHGVVIDNYTRERIAGKGYISGLRRNENCYYRQSRILLYPVTWNR